MFFVKNWFYSKQFEYFLITKNSTNIQIYLYKGSHVLLGGGVNSGGFVGFFLFLFFFVSIQVWKSLAFHMKCLLITLSSCWTLQFCIKVFVLTLLVNCFTSDSNHKSNKWEVPIQQKYVNNILTCERKHYKIMKLFKILFNWKKNFETVLNDKVMHFI